MKKPPAAPKPDLHAVVEALAEASTALTEMPLGRREFPSRTAVAALVEDLRALLFPGYFGASELTAETLRYHLGARMDRVLHGLSDQIQRGLMASDPACTECRGRSVELAQAFLARLPQVRHLLATDIQAGFEGDPAATSPEEVLFSYPGLLAVASQRLAHELLKLGVPLLPRMITEHAHSLTGIDIHPGAQIGERFFIDHGTGVVIGETCVIGRNVRIYQGVTLGAKSFPLDAEGHPVKGVPRHPVVEDDVIVYSNATVLGRITLGKGSAIGGNVWLTRSVPPGSVITQANEKDGMPS
ncbi:serine O-acetyltransferase [Geothrix sp.]|uniref:serine O-acetyltransferase n=1 Tax=Geothrix sp. TaxID=1962974 RepID=UPI002630705A|nr:serine acetyltransferase [Geothrix sp.]WIL20180.1 MAG: serine acetyltransferase [Geothrix sp.]